MILRYWCFREVVIICLYHGIHSSRSQGKGGFMLRGTATQSAVMSIISTDRLTAVIRYCLQNHMLFTNREKYKLLKHKKV